MNLRKAVCACKDLIFVAEIILELSAPVGTALRITHLTGQEPTGGITEQWVRIFNGQAGNSFSKKILKVWEVISLLWM